MVNNLKNIFLLDVLKYQLGECPRDIPTNSSKKLY